MSDLIHLLKKRLQVYQPVDRWADTALHKGEAAVLIAVTDSTAPEIILTKRSEALSSHRGEVALPGGRIDPTDADVIHAALRESHEEVGLAPESVQVLGKLDPMVTRFGVKVTPVVGLVAPDIELIPNYNELDAVFRVPLDFLLRDERLRTDIGTIGQYKVQVPCWQYQGFEIWGVTAVILTTFMNRIYDRNIMTGMESINWESGGKYTPQDWREVEGGKGITE